MTLTLTLGDQLITLVFRNGSERVLPFYRYVYRQFLIHDRSEGKRLEICPLPLTRNALFDVSEAPEMSNESAFAKEQLDHWLAKHRKLTDDSQITHRPIGIRSLNGLLLFSQETKSGRIYVPDRDPYPYRSLYRLFWIFFAQVLGETGGCFLHAASVVKEGQGFVLMGGSGTGKSTLARRINHGNVIADEAPVIFNGGKNIRVYPSPYHQLNPEATFSKTLITAGAPIENLYFIILDGKQFVEAVSITDAIAMIMARYIHFFYFITPEARTKIFDLFHRTCHKLPIFCLHFAEKTDVWKMLS